MAEPFIGQIQMVGFNFAPRGYAFCSGQILSIAQNTALFSLLGTTYGGNGQTTFALPDLRGRVPMHPGQGLGLTPRVLGEQTGTEAVTLIGSNMPAHTHTTSVACYSAGGNSTDPTGKVWSKDAGVQTGTYSNAGANAQMRSDAVIVSPVGGNQPHNNMQPYLVVNFVIAVEGIYPSRN